ncbi:speckle-type POZ protein [Nephila pilipes]|uniref:Speckle-type POZ protein n=1 Tax=Nephila pilipes TaxID=299642 RepID=A0A8X6UKD0_NEPPI|nr:speckle-type POZ protein [Nephila pilipes]
MNNLLLQKDINSTLETVTRVDVSKDTLVWSIDNFSLLQQDPNLELCSPTLNNNSHNKPRWGIKVKKGNQFGTRFYDFYLILYTLPRHFYQPIRIELNVHREYDKKALLAREMYLSLHYKNEHVGNDVYLPVSEKIISIVQSQINSWTATSLRLECIISYKVHSIVSMKGNEELLPPNLSNISSFKQFYLSEKLSDFSLEVDDEVLPVHRLVLTYHSSVFAAMMESDMRENRDRLAVISDIPASVLKDLLHYMYCGMVENLTPEKAILVYEAADIYNVQHLKEECAHYLCNHMNDDISANVLRLANMYNDKKLETAVRLLLNRKNE